ncbi:MAG: FAD-dependent oxidoreductase, partial [Clostridia bacterium]|nr:FAD-dependent oxidoreductase [Clostridia bacterium]
MTATVIGGGLAGCEAAWALANHGVAVTLYEMKPVRFSPAHHSEALAELVCSNSLKAQRLGSAAGLLKEEMRRLGSLCMAVADTCAVPAGGALAVDRDDFANGVTRAVE